MHHMRDIEAAFVAQFFSAEDLEGGDDETYASLQVYLKGQPQKRMLVFGPSVDDRFATKLGDVSVSVSVSSVDFDQRKMRIVVGR